MWIFPEMENEKSTETWVHSSVIYHFTKSDIFHRRVCAEMSICGNSMSINKVSLHVFYWCMKSFSGHVNTSVCHFYVHSGGAANPNEIFIAAVLTCLALLLRTWQLSAVRSDRCTCGFKQMRLPRRRSHRSNWIFPARSLGCVAIVGWIARTLRGEHGSIISRVQHPGCFSERALRQWIWFKRHGESTTRFVSTCVAFPGSKNCTVWLDRPTIAREDTGEICAPNVPRYVSGFT